MVKKILWIVATVLIGAYLVVSLLWTHKATVKNSCTGMTIEISDTTNNRFVSVADIVRELDSLPLRCEGMLLDKIDTDSIESILNSIDKIESATCVIDNNGMVKITVVPMNPVARIFDDNTSYYINKDGKYISADARYYIDVPVISGHFDSVFSATSLLPLINYVYSDSVWSSFVTMVKVDSPNDILLVPVIRGHIVNFGDISNIENKFRRLRHMYRNVLPVKGWNVYDTLSVKWSGQVVATKRKKGLEKPAVDIVDTSEHEVADTETMLVEESSDTITFKNYKSVYNK